MNPMLVVMFNPYAFEVVENPNLIEGSILIQTEGGFHYLHGRYYRFLTNEEIKDIKDDQMNDYLNEFFG